MAVPLEKIMNSIKYGLISIAAMVAFSPTVIFADDDWVTVYGKIDVTMDKVDEEGGDNHWELVSHASRFGVKGKGAAGENLQAFYQLEWQVDVADNSKENITSRNQIIGIRGDFGEVFLGRHDTPTKSLQKKIDLFGDKPGDIKSSFNAEKRADNIVQYSTPEMSGFKVKAAFIPGEETANNDGIADGTSIALEYVIEGLSLGLSFDSDVEDEAVDTTRLIAQYKIAALQLGLIYQRSDYAADDGDGIMASVKYSDGNGVYKLQTIDSDIWQVGVSSKVKYSSQTSIGYDHKLGKKMTAYGYFTQGKEGATDNEDSVFGVGLILKF